VKRWCSWAGMLSPARRVYYIMLKSNQGLLVRQGAAGCYTLLQRRALLTVVAVQLRRTPFPADAAAPLRVRARARGPTDAAARVIASDPARLPIAQTSKERLGHCMQILSISLQVPRERIRVYSIG